MIIGKVVGTVICTRKNPDLIGNKFMIVDPMEKMSAHGADRIVAVDDVGSSARLGITDPNSPVDACIVGIVDDPQKIVIVE